MFSTVISVAARTAGALAVMGSALVVHSGPLAAASMASGRYEGGISYIQIDGQRYRLQTNRLDEVAQGQGLTTAPEAAVTSTLFVTAEEPGATPGSFDSAGNLKPMTRLRVRVLDPDRGRAQRTTGRRAASLPDWELLLTVTTTSDGEKITTTYQTVADSVSIAIPKRLAGSRGRAVPDVPAGPIEIEVNGRVTRVDPELLSEALRYVSGDRSVLVPRHGQTLDRVFSRIEDRPRFLHAMHAYYTSRYAVGLLDSADSESDCTGVCLGCAGSIIGVGLGAAAIGASCGGVVLTGGGSLAICWLAIVGGHATVLTSAASCAACDHCRSRPVPEEPGSPGNGGNGDPCDPCDGCEGPPPPSCDDGGDTPAAGAAQ